MAPVLRNPVGGVLGHVFLCLGATLAGGLVEPVETRGDPPLGDLGGAAVGVLHQVAGELLTHKAVKGLVGVEGGYHVVTIPPGSGPRIIARKAAGVAIACDIQPVLCPLLPVTGTAEQLFDQ